MLWAKACKTNIIDAEENKSNMLKNVLEFNEKSRPRSKEGKNKKQDTLKFICPL